MKSVPQKVYLVMDMGAQWEPARDIYGVFYKESKAEEFLRELSGKDPYKEFIIEEFNIQDAAQR